LAQPLDVGERGPHGDVEVGVDAGILRRPPGLRRHPAPPAERLEGLEAARHRLGAGSLRTVAIADSRCQRGPAPARAFLSRDGAAARLARGGPDRLGPRGGSRESVPGNSRSRRHPGRRPHRRTGTRRLRRLRVEPAPAGGVRAPPDRFRARVGRHASAALPGLEPAARARLRARTPREPLRRLRALPARVRVAAPSPGGRGMTYRRKDAYYRRARAAGYRARSAYKLSQLDSRFRLLRRGDVVVDLGAWPGGWLQVALEAVGPHGRVVGVDLV